MLLQQTQVSSIFTSSTLSDRIYTFTSNEAEKNLKRRDWFYVLLPLVFSWAFDRLTKIWASGLSTLKFIGPFGFILHHNHGAILGIFSDIPSVLPSRQSLNWWRVSSLSFFNHSISSANKVNVSPHWPVFSH